MNRTPPHDDEAEETVIGGILLHPRDAVPKVIGRVAPEDFYHPARREIFAAIVELDATSRPIDALTVRDCLHANRRLDMLTSLGGVQYLHEVTARVIVTEGLGYHARMIANKAQRRRWIEAAQRIAALGYGGEADEACDDAIERLVFETSKAKRVMSDPVDMPTVMREVLTHMEEQVLRDRAGAPLGVPSGLAHFDAMTTGFQPGDLVVIAARPSMGKTALALDLVAGAANERMPSLVFSREMSRRALGERMVARRANVNSAQVRTGRLHSVARNAVITAAGDLARMPVHIHDASGLDFPQLRSLARRWRTGAARDSEFGVIVVDYLQLLSWHSKGDQREREVARISGGLKDLAKELNVPVIALSQLNRSLENRENKRPTLADLRESGAIEQDADVIAFLYRDEVYNPQSSDKGIAEIIIGKQRNGPIGTVRVKCDMSTGRFTNLELSSEAA